MLPPFYSFKLLSRDEARRVRTPSSLSSGDARRVDNNKRAFIKLLGVVGLGFIVTALFPKKADALVFGSAPASNVVGVKNASNTRINPATNEKLDAIVTALNASGGYKISDLDDSGTINYFGYVASTGAWYILAYNTSTNTFRYIKGDSSYSTNWTNRSSLSYDYYDVVF